MLLMLAMSAHAQNDVTKFLGIPVDGTKSEMIRQLKAKGYSYDQYNDRLTGEFNGTKVEIYVVTTNNKVSRIMVCDANYVDERSIQIRFNRLCDQFKNNPNYTPLFSENNPIPDDEDISYEISVHKKRYEAVFYQTLDKDWLAKEVPMLISKYTDEQVENPTGEEMANMIIAYALEKNIKKSVWFMISDLYDRYYITMFYDNEYNRANGEDL